MVVLYQSYTLNISSFARSLSTQRSTTVPATRVRTRSVRTASEAGSASATSAGAAPPARRVRCYILSNLSLPPPSESLLNWSVIPLFEVIKLVLCLLKSLFTVVRCCSGNERQAGCNDDYHKSPNNCCTHHNHHQGTHYKLVWLALRDCVYIVV